MKARKIEAWKDNAGGISWHARGQNGRVITPSESFTRWRAARANALAAYPQAKLPTVWLRGFKHLMLIVKTGQAVWT